MPLRLVETSQSTTSRRSFSLPAPRTSAPGKAGVRGGKTNCSSRRGRSVSLGRAGRFCPLLRTPVLLELHRRQIAQRRMDPLVIVHVVQEAAQLTPGLGVALIVRQIDFFLLDGSHKALSEAILFRRSDCGHADLAV